MVIIYGWFMDVHCKFVPLNSMQSNFTPPDFYALIFSIPPLIPMHWNLFLFDYYVMRLYPSLIIMYWNFVPLDQKIKYSNNIIILCIYAYKAYIILTFLHSNVVPLLTLYAQILLPPLTLCTQFCPPLTLCIQMLSSLN